MSFSPNEKRHLIGLFLFSLIALYGAYYWPIDQINYVMYGVSFIAWISFITAFIVWLAWVLVIDNKNVERNLVDIETIDTYLKHYGNVRVCYLTIRIILSGVVSFSLSVSGFFISAIIYLMYIYTLNDIIHRVKNYEK